VGRESDGDNVFMLKVLPDRPGRVDGTGRSQSVDRANNLRYFGLIEAFSQGLEYFI
jgi:hypothetical protein